MASDGMETRSNRTASQPASGHEVAVFSCKRSSRLTRSIRMLMVKDVRDRSARAPGCAGMACATAARHMPRLLTRQPHAELGARLLGGRHGKLSSVGSDDL